MANRQVLMPKRYALQLVERAARDVRLSIDDPAQAPKLLPRIYSDLTRANASFLDPRGAQVLVVVPGLTPLNLGVGVALPVAGPTVPLRWTEDGKVLGVRVSNSLATDVGNAALGLKVTTKDGNSNLVTNGQSEAFAPFILLNEVDSPWLPLDIDVRHDERWDIATQGVVAGLGMVLPIVMFMFEAKQKSPTQLAAEAQDAGN